MSAAITELIAKLETVTEGSRELDAEIMFDLYAKPVGKKEDDGPSGYLWPDDDPSWSFGIRFPGKSRDWFFQGHDNQEKLVIERDGAFVLMNSLRVPRLTTSIDAALTLVPKDARVHELCQWWDIDEPGGWCCNVTRWEYDSQLRLIERVYAHGFAEADIMPRLAPNAALALCIAALKARAAVLTPPGPK